MKKVFVTTTFVLLLIVAGLIYFRTGDTSAQTYFVTNPAPSVTFTATPNSLFKGQSSTLSWTTDRADSCTMPAGFLSLFPKDVGTSGSMAVSPSSDTTYDITCNNSQGSTTEHAIVKVSPCTSTSSCYGSTVNMQVTKVTVRDPSGNTTTVVSSPIHGPVDVAANPSDYLQVSTTTTITNSNSFLVNLYTPTIGGCVGWQAGAKFFGSSGSFDMTEGMSVSNWFSSTGVTGIDPSFLTVNYGNQLIFKSECSFGTSFVFGQADNIFDDVQLNVQSGQVIPQQTSSTLSATLLANPSTITQPGVNQTGTTTLTATVGGTATGSTTYTFYCNTSGSALPASSSNATTCGYNSPGNYTAKVVVKRAGLSTTATTKITVQAPGPSVTLQASPSSIRPGGTSTLSWSSTNANSCTATGPWPGGEGAKNISGSVSVSPSQSTTYYLSCSGPGGTAATSATVMIQGAPTLDIKIQ